VSAVELHLVDDPLEVERREALEYLAATDTTADHVPAPLEAERLEAGGDHSRVAESFQPVDLAAMLAGTIEQPRPTMLVRRGDGAPSCLMYEGVINGIHGDSGTGKSWLAFVLLAERMQLGEHVMLIDLEDTPSSVVARLRMIGVTDERIASQLVYVRPTEAFGPIEVAHLVDIINERNVTAVVIDSLGEAFGTEGINEDRDNEVGPWLRGVARVLAAAGPAVVLIDHSVKSQERQQLHPSGSKRKRAAIGGASYLVEAVTPFSNGESGRLRVICAKDRHGTYRRGDHVAWLDMTSHPDGTATLELVAPAPKQTDDAREANVRDELARAIREVLADGEMSKAALTAALRWRKVKASNVTISDAVTLMTHCGGLIERSGSRGAKLIALPGAAPS
jgi:AAA domain